MIADLSESICNFLYEITTSAAANSYESYAMIGTNSDMHLFFKVVNTRGMDN